MPCIISLKVTPSSGRSQCVLDKKAGQLKCFLKSPPERGQANAELIGIFAKALGISKDSISILAGETGRKKMIKILGDFSYEQVLEALGIEVQQSFLLK